MTTVTTNPIVTNPIVSVGALADVVAESRTCYTVFGFCFMNYDSCAPVSATCGIGTISTRGNL